MAVILIPDELTSSAVVTGTNISSTEMPCMT
jgi:hypothetical protein